ncbi:MAG: MFS transporter [Candidatus Nanoarchaeia archaeon]
MRLTNNQKYHLRNAGLWASYNALTAMFMTPFVLALGASNTEVGLVGALPYFAILITQIPGVKLLELFTRVQVYTVGTLIGRLSWIPIIIVALSGRADVILVVACLYFIGKFGESLADPAYHTVMGDIAPKKTQGEFYGKRLWIFSFWGTLAYIFGGFFLGWYGSVLDGFTILFGLGILFGLYSIRTFRRTNEPVFVKDKKIKLTDFASMSSQFKYFCWFVGIFHFAFMVAQPFYTVFMLKTLGLSYELFVLALSVQTITKLASQQWLGRMTDRMGEKLLGFVSLVVLTCVPLLFLLISVDNLWLLVVAQVLAGLGLAGVGVVLGNLLLDLTPKNHRAVGMAQYTMMLGGTMAVAPLLGGWIADNVTVVGFSGLPLVFVISAILMVCSIYFIYQVKEPRGRKYPLRYLRSFVWHKLRRIMDHGGNHGL